MQRSRDKCVAFFKVPWNVRKRAVARKFLRVRKDGSVRELNSNSKSWFAVRVKSNREQITARALRSQGYEEFVPVFRRSRRSFGRTKTVEFPLFPGYVFSRFDKEKRLPILMLPGVIHVVGIGKEPVPIDNVEIASIRVIAESPFLSEPCPFLNVGERVEVVSGPLTGAQGVILGVKNKYRLIASMTLLQRSIAVEIDRESVEARG
jgi:transcription termination/antitermination protein NusG